MIRKQLTAAQYGLDIFSMSANNNDKLTKPVTIILSLMVSGLQLYVGVGVEGRVANKNNEYSSPITKAKPLPSITNPIAGMICSNGTGINNAMAPAIIINNPAGGCWR